METGSTNIWAPLSIALAAALLGVATPAHAATNTDALYALDRAADLPAVENYPELQALVWQLKAALSVDAAGSEAEPAAQRAIQLAAVLQELDSLDVSPDSYQEAVRRAIDLHTAWIGTSQTTSGPLTHSITQVADSTLRRGLAEAADAIRAATTSKVWPPGTQGFLNDSYRLDLMELAIRSYELAGEAASAQDVHLVWVQEEEVYRREMAAALGAMDRAQQHHAARPMGVVGSPVFALAAMPWYGQSVPIARDIKQAFDILEKRGAGELNDAATLVAAIGNEQERAWSGVATLLLQAGAISVGASLITARQQRKWSTDLHEVGLGGELVWRRSGGDVR